eukprot:scaffold446275_cov55-Attheya_sp.AAC.1
MEEDVTRIIPLEEFHADEERYVEDGPPPPLPPLQEGAASRPNRFFLYYIVLVGALVALVVALSVSLAVVVSRDDNEPPPTAVDEQLATSDDRMFEGGSDLAKMPVALVDFLSDVVAFPAGADGRRRLALPPDMLEKLNGKCATLDDYTSSSNTPYWQCAQNKNNPTYPLEGNDASEGTAYKPKNDVLGLLASATGASLSSLQSMNIGPDQPSELDGSWCGMPAPGADKLKNDGTLSPQDRLAYDYWLQCVSPRAGFFNTLQCEGDCNEDGGNCSTYAVLGYAAMDPSVCYAAHQHMSEEAYWQIGGRGWWRTWNNVSEVDNHIMASNDNFGGSKYAFHPHRSGTPHEFDTTNNLDGDEGAGTLEDPMVMVYWWGLDDAISNDYHWANQTRENPYTYQDSAHSCGNTRRIP